MCQFSSKEQSCAIIIVLVWDFDYIFNYVVALLFIVDKLFRLFFVVILCFDLRVWKTPRRSLHIPTRSAPPRNPHPPPLTHINLLEKKGKYVQERRGPNQNPLKNNGEGKDENHAKLRKTIIWHAIFVPKDIFPSKIRHSIPPKIWEERTWRPKVK